MIGETLTNQFADICKGFATNRRVLFDPRPIHKALAISPQGRNKQVRNINLFLNSSKYRNLIRQLQKELDNALSK